MVVNLERIHRVPLERVVAPSQGQREGVVDAKQAALCSSGLSDAPNVPLAARFVHKGVHPFAQAVQVGVPSVSGQLDSVYHAQVFAREGVRLSPARVGEVVGERDEVQSKLAGRLEHA